MDDARNVQSVLIMAVEDEEGLAVLKSGLNALQPGRVFLITSNESYGVQVAAASLERPGFEVSVYRVKDADAGYMEFYAVSDLWMDALLNLPAGSTVYLNLQAASRTAQYILNFLGSNLKANGLRVRLLKAVRTLDGLALRFSDA